MGAAHRAQRRPLNTTNVFHPITRSWFDARFDAPTEPQRLGWEAIARGEHTLVAAPTGSGKTLTAFLVCIDRLLVAALDGSLDAATRVVYVSPLKALSNDIQRNLEVPLREIQARAARAGVQAPELRAQVRTGDTPASERQRMLRRPPHIVVTTPESLYLLLTAEKSRAILGTVDTVIVDEIHVLAGDKRGSHLSLSLARLEALSGRGLQRIGLSATQRPLRRVAQFLVGTANVDSRSGEPRCTIIDSGHARELDLGIEAPESELGAVCSGDTWSEIYALLAERIRCHRATLVFVNTRRLAERIAQRLSEELGHEAVASHHGSLSRCLRLDAEERLKTGRLRAIVATASLELGIDVGYIDLVCQIGSPRSIATFLQRVGRSGHSLGKVPKGRLFPLTRDELLESMALVRAVRCGELDAIHLPTAPLDILAQQIVATVATGGFEEEALFELCRQAWPYRSLERDDFDAVIAMLSEPSRGPERFGVYLHRDRINGRLRARRRARLAALWSGGAIPENADFRVVTENDGTFVGTVNEDFALESMSGDIFLLGNTSWQIRHVRGGEVVVRDARGAPATIPFWLGEAPGRTVELSREVSRLREELAQRTDHAHGEPASGGSPDGDLADWLRRECSVDSWSATQALRYTAAQTAALGSVPTQKRIFFERFFDQSGGMQLVIHAPFGARVLRAWGLALRKRFCRSFNFELQAAANDNGIVLSLGPQHSFPIDALFRMVNPANLTGLLSQAILAVPMFLTRWRWNTTRALAVLRRQGGKKVPPPLQRFRADDYLSAVFPAQTACLENHVGDIDIPDHPLVRQTVHDCLHEAMAVEDCRKVLQAIERGDIELVGVDTREPSPFSHELLNANPYAFLDNAPLEERRARAVATRRSTRPEEFDDLAQLAPEAIDQVKREAWPTVRDEEELHEALLLVGAVPVTEGAAWNEWLPRLVEAGRATTVSAADRRFLVAAECWPLVEAAWPEASAAPPVELPPELAAFEGDELRARTALVRGRLGCVGPVTARRLADALGFSEAEVAASLGALEGEGVARSGRFSQAERSGASRAPEKEWCERRLLARIHRLTLESLREKIQPVEPRVFWRFLMEHHSLLEETQRLSSTGLFAVIEQLQGYDLPAAAWESEVLAARVKEYEPAWLDDLLLSGTLMWGRLRTPRPGDRDASTNAQRLTRTVPLSLLKREDLSWLLSPEREERAPGSGDASQVLEALRGRGALFVQEIGAATGLLASQVERALGELIALGLVTADGFSVVRTLDRPLAARRPSSRPSSRPALRRAAGGDVRRTEFSHPRGGRWSLFPGPVRAGDGEVRMGQWARQLLARYGILCRDLLARETLAPPWSDVARVLRRLELRGDVRGGRFVAGLAGEQFATPGTVERLRALREEAPAGEWVVVAAVDPINLSGILGGGRVPAVPGAALLLADGRLLASRHAGTTQIHIEADPATAERMATALELGPQARSYLNDTRSAELRVRVER